MESKDLLSPYYTTFSTLSASAPFMLSSKKLYQNKLIKEGK
jgi:hypothetical protein